jgi:hypothetical protein
VHLVLWLQKHEQSLAEAKDELERLHEAGRRMTEAWQHKRVELADLERTAVQVLVLPVLLRKKP